MDRITIEMVGDKDDIDRFIRIRKSNGDVFVFHNQTQFYIDSYEGLRWDEEEIEALLRFLGFDIFKVIHSQGGK